MVHPSLALALLSSIVPLVASVSPVRADAAVPPALRADYDPERGAYIASPDGSWELNPYGMLQVQNVTLWDRGRAAQAGFTLRAAKLILHGHVLSREVTYHLQLNAGDGKVAAEDVYMRWEPAGYLGLLVGQNEVPFNRQHITLEAYQQLVERSSVDSRFNLQRDIGAQLMLHDSQLRVEWTSGIWNGARQNSANDDRSYMLTTRLSVNPWGPIAFREADLAYSTDPRLSLALAFAYNPRRVIPASAAGGSTSELRHIAQAVGEITLRYRGLSVSTETHVRSQARSGAASARDWGQLAQVGLFVLPERVELVSRLAFVRGSLVETDIAREAVGGINWYLHRHRFKLQLDYANLLLASRAVEQRVRLQLELFL